MAAIKAAQAAASQLPSQVQGAQPNHLPVNTDVALHGPALGLAQMLQGGMQVNIWLRVNEYGLFFGPDKVPFEKVTLGLDLSEVGYCYCIRYGNPATYEKSYDHVTSVRGGSWAETVMRARQIDPTTSEYRSADIPFIALEDIKNFQGQVVVEKGKKVGHSLSLTGWRSWVEFVKDLVRAGMDPEQGLISLDIGVLEQRNAKGTWGIPTFSNAKQLEILCQGKAA
jgi:hypothetical protein